MSQEVTQSVENLSEEVTLSLISLLSQMIDLTPLLISSLRVMRMSSLLISLQKRVMRLHLLSETLSIDR